MILLVRVDDRLLHGQVIGAWIPSTRADLLVVASDEAAADSFRSSVMAACADHGFSVMVRSVDDAAMVSGKGEFDNARAVLIVSDLKDAMRLYKGGVTFSSLNIGNVHHGDGRALTRTVILNDEDDDIIEAFEGFGVAIDIRDLPNREPISYARRSL